MFEQNRLDMRMPREDGEEFLSAVAPEPGDADGRS
jgi:hypothetical protein